METVDTFERFVESSRWQFAKTMPEKPHEYTLKKWLDEDQADTFVAMVEFIRERGTRDVFEGRAYIYYHHDGFKYWTMGRPADETKLINRAVDA